jgi:hypothetical protein
MRLAIFNCVVPTKAAEPGPNIGAFTPVFDGCAARENTEYGPLPSQGRREKPTHSIFTPAAFTTSPHLARSVLVYAVNSSGVVATGSAPTTFNALITSGDFQT